MTDLEIANSVDKKNILDICNNIYDIYNNANNYCHSDSETSEVAPANPKLVM